MISLHVDVGYAAVDVTQTNFINVLIARSDFVKYSEETLKSWKTPASNTEEQRINNTINMIKSAIDGCANLNDLDIDIFVQGSYANNTNVRTNSDVDVCVMLTSTFYTEYPDGKTREDYGFIEGTMSFDEYKQRIKNAIVNKFGADSVSIGNKSLKIRSNSYHINADVVVAFMLKNYKIIESTDPEKYVEGTRFFDINGMMVTNFPKVHLANGTKKNNATNHQYKFLVRMFKKIRNNMVDDHIINEDKISSFLTECLVWNIPNEIITGYDTWEETIRQSILYLFNAIKSDKHKEWGEVSECLYLFHSGRKWTDKDVQAFLESMWDYLGYNK